MQATARISYEACGTIFRFKDFVRDNGRTLRNGMDSTVSERAQNWVDDDGSAAGYTVPLLIGSATAEAAGQGHQLEVAQAADDTAEAPGEEPSGSMTRAGFWDGEGASLVSTATSLDDLLATSGDIPTVARWENQSAEATASPPL